MDILNKTIHYVEYDNSLKMHIIKSFNYKAKLDMKCIKLIQQELLNKGNNLKVHEIFNEIAELNTEVMSVVVLQSIKNCTRTTDYEVMKVMEFKYALDLINKLIEVSMPLKDISTEESEFEDDEDISIEDWDFDYMTYLWYSVIKRNDDFYNITPKYYFKQVELHRKFTGPKEDEKVEYI